MMADGEIIFRPYFVQQGRGPHMGDFVRTFDMNEDVFYSDMEVDEQGIRIQSTHGQERFGIYVRWNVEGFGYLFLPADNGGEYYPSDAGEFHLNYELANTRVGRNNRRLDSFLAESNWKPSRELQAYLELGEEYLEDAKKHRTEPKRCAEFAQQSLKFAMYASDLLELEKARFDIRNKPPRPDFLFGCDTRGFFQMDEVLFLERFTPLFNYATITHYLIGDHINFEPEEGDKQFTERDRLLDILLEKGIAVEGRPLFWTHSWVTPDWLKEKSFDQTLTYLEDHIRIVVGHYGDRIKVWEVVNEVHDWANELEFTPDQFVELTKFTCDVARDVNPDIKLLINNCCPFAPYIQKRKWHEKEAKYPQRTPHQFTTDLLDAGVDFDLIGVQEYFVRHPVAEAVRVIERYSDMGIDVQIAEIGAPSAGVKQEFVEDEVDPTTVPYDWRRHWDEELQADWLEYIFTYAYSNPSVEAANWYDFVDPYGFLKKGGLLRSVDGDTKAAVDRLQKLKEKWAK